jgi:hypothetical protein
MPTSSSAVIAREKPMPDKPEPLTPEAIAALTVGSVIPCPACGVGIKLVQRGDKLVGRHACCRLPSREVFETDAPAPSPEPAAAPAAPAVKPAAKSEKKE